jgi:hypothetical protein
MSGRRQWGEDSTVCLKLSAGASISLRFKGNLFDLTREERELISSLTDVIRIYKDAAEAHLIAEQPEELQHG